MTATKITVRDVDEQVLGWVYLEIGGPGLHPDCRRAVDVGRLYHAIPAGFAKTLPEYHFRSWDAAIASLG